MRVAGAGGLALLLMAGCGSRTNPFVLESSWSGTGGILGSAAGGGTASGGQSASGGAEGDGSTGGQRSSGGAFGAGGGEGSGGRPQKVAVERVEVGGTHSCALLTDGAVRCWGNPAAGQLGYGNTEAIGDDPGETPASAGNVPIGGRAVELSVNAWQSCVLLDTGAVRCWGASPAVGYPGYDFIGDDETPASVGDVSLGEPALHIETGASHTCALLAGGRLRCWGDADSGRLGYGNLEIIGDDETPASAGDVPVGGVVVDVTCGNGHTCVLLNTGAVRCWGYGGGGALGYGNTNTIGDDETPASAGDIDLGGPAVQVAAGNWHTCALLETGAVRCWGHGAIGALGYGNTDDIGDDESPAAAGDVEVGGEVVELIGGKPSMCALLATGALRCWGEGADGRLGYGSTNRIGDDETPAAAGDVPLGEAVVQATASSSTCALFASGSVKCWGSNFNYTLGQPGRPYFENIGDDETPDTAPPILILDP